jgi:hypothetical protein
MALNKQPYLPLYVKDWLSNRKLRECSMASNGLMINLMALMHREDDYGKITLSPRFKTSENILTNFSNFLSKLLPFFPSEIEPCLQELLDVEVLKISHSTLVCERMVRDENLSKLRASAGAKGGKTAQSKSKKNDGDFANDFALAKDKANSVNVNANANVSILIENTLFEKSEKLFANIPSDSYFGCKELADVYSTDEKLLNAVAKRTGKTVEYLRTNLHAFVDHLAALGRNTETAAEFAKYFLNAMKMAKQPDWTIGISAAPTTDFYVWNWKGQAAKKGSKQQYEADKRNFGQFDFKTIKIPANA